MTRLHFSLALSALATLAIACSDSGAVAEDDDSSSANSTSGNGGGTSAGNGGMGGTTSSTGGSSPATTGTGGAGGSTTASSGGSGGSASGTGGAGGAPSVCGNGDLEIGETCDDGVITANCDTWHDGGDGTCVAPGTCSNDYVLVNGTCEPEHLTADVLIDVSNTCVMSVAPLEFVVPAGQRLQLSYRNISNDYPVDIWKSYGGGFLDLPTGGTWNETYEHCFGPSPVNEYADISTACSSFRLWIRCQ